MGDLRTLVRRLPGCARLGPEALAALAGLARTEVFPAGARLVVEGEPAPDWYGLVESGGVQVSRLDLESDEILDYLAEGDVLDPGAPGLPAPWSATAIETARCVLLPQSGVARHRGALTDGAPAVYGGDTGLLSRRVADMVTGPPVTAEAGMTVTRAAALMSGRGVGSVIVMGPDGAPAGIVTDRDLRTKVVADRLPLTTPIGAIMSAPLAVIEADRLAVDALLHMTRQGIHHLGVVTRGRFTGVISSHDVVLAGGAHPVMLVRDIDGASSVAELARAVRRQPAVVRWLAGARAGPLEIGRVMAELNDRLVCRALALAQEAIEPEHGSPPADFTWVAGGSEGRREQTLRTDQDNGIVYEDPTGDDGRAAGYFGALGATLGHMLTAVGFPPCPGGFMASNPRWCQPVSVWRRYFAGWMETPTPADLLEASVFCDLRAVGGKPAPAGRLWEWVCRQAPRQTLFLRHLARSALEHHVPLGFLGGFVVERSGAHKGALDIKARGAFPVTQALRVHALSLGSPETNTLDRLAAAEAEGVFRPAEARDVREAHEVIARVRLAHQLECLDAGQPPDNFVNPETLGRADRLLLREAFRTVAWLQRHLEDRFQTSLLG
jgi:CBS domain-containing protein